MATLLLAFLVYFFWLSLFLLTSIAICQRLCSDSEISLVKNKREEFKNDENVLAIMHSRDIHNHRQIKHIETNFLTSFDTLRGIFKRRNGHDKI